MEVSILVNFIFLDEYCIGNINENTLGKLAKNKLLDQFLKKKNVSHHFVKSVLL